MLVTFPFSMTWKRSSGRVIMLFWCLTIRQADPAIIALLLERSNLWISENIVYVAGDRVVTDPLCKPFCMGRNLICVYSKKHMNDFPELIDMKRWANTRSFKEMALFLWAGKNSLRLCTTQLLISIMCPCLLSLEAVEQLRQTLSSHSHNFLLAELRLGESERGRGGEGGVWGGLRGGGRVGRRLWRRRPREVGGSGLPFFLQSDALKVEGKNGSR